MYYVIGFFINRSKQSSDGDISQAQAEIEAIRSERDEAREQRAEFSGRLQKSVEEFQKQDTALKSQIEEIKELTGKVKSLEAERNNLEEKLMEQKGEVEKLNERFEQILEA